MTGFEAPAAILALDAHDAGLLDRRAGAFGTLQQHAVEFQAGVNHYRMGQIHARFAGFGRADHGLMHDFLGREFSSRNGYSL